jgi:hypothetical protein
VRPASPVPVKRRLLVPAVLAVSSFSSACGGKEGTTVATEAQTEATSATTEETPTSTGGTGTGTGTTGTTGGELPDCPSYSDDPETCSSMVQCIFLINQDACIVRCDNFKDQATCEMQMYCYWEGGCYLAV